MVKLSGLSILVLITVSGCVSLAPDYERPTSPVPDQFLALDNLKHKLTTSVSKNDSEVPIDLTVLGWRNYFADPQLQTYIEMGLKNNRDLKLAVLKVAEARSQYRLQNSERYPQANSAFSLQYAGENTTKTSQEYSVGLDLNFELDFFGRLKNMSQAELQRYFATEAAQRSTHILLVSQIAERYLNEQLATQQLTIATKNLNSYLQSFNFMEQRVQSGKATLLELEQARSLIEVAKGSKAQRERELKQARHGLELLVGQYHLVATPVAATRSPLKLTLPDNIPSSVLLKRPDILEAEYLLKAANADIGVARAAFFPSISLTGGLSNTSVELASLFSGATAWQFMPKIELPIFKGGKNKATLELSKIRKESSILQYEKVIQAAFKEVADALVARDTYTQQITAQKRYLQSQRIASQLANTLYANGVVSYIEILDAQRNVFAAEQMLLDLIQTQLMSEINLFIALGGGWKE